MKKIVMFILLLALGISMTVIFSFYTHDKNKIFHGTLFISNNSSTCIGGMNRSKIHGFISRSSTHLLSTPVIFKVKSKRLKVSLKDIGIEINSRKLADKLHKKTYNSNIINYVSQRLKRESIAIDIDKFITINKITFNMFYKNNINIFKSTPHSAKVVLKDGIISSTASSEGYEIKYPELPYEILKSIRSHRYILILPAYTIKPAISKETADKLLPRELLAAFSTSYSSSSAARKTNIKLASAKLNNVILAPDQVFDFYTYVGEPSISKGYRIAPVYISGKVSQGIGGGMCQVSTTLYNAAILSDLKILKRFNHALPVHYIPLGLDAAVAYGLNTLSFRNTTGGFLLIKSSADGNTLTFYIYGYKKLTVKISTYSVKRSSNTYDAYRTVYSSNKKLRTDYLGRSTYK